MTRQAIPQKGPMPVTGKIGDVIRKRREALHMSQETLAHAAGLSALSVHLLETHQRYPLMDTVERIALALDTVLAVLITEASLEP